MYAVFEDSGRQFRVKKNDSIDIDLRELPEDTDRIEFDHVLLVGDEAGEAETKVGQPWLAGAKVVGTIEGEVKGDKIEVIKFRRRKGYRRKQGHRQHFFRVKIDAIEGV